MKNAIQKAIEGGWKYQGNSKTDETVREGHVKVYMNDENDEKLYIPFNEILLDPAFWQSLGKALGWKPGESLSEHLIENLTPEDIRLFFSQELQQARKEGYEQGMIDSVEFTHTHSQLPMPEVLIDKIHSLITPTN